MVELDKIKELKKFRDRAIVGFRSGYFGSTLFLHYFLPGFFVFGIHASESLMGVKIPIDSKLRWKLSIQDEIASWDAYFKTEGFQLQDKAEDPWSPSYRSKLNPFLQLQEGVVSLLPENKTEVEILDVGAGPLTCLGKVCKGLKINITAVDPLASEYDNLLKKYHISPLIQTKKGDAEKLTELFSENSFDLVFACNSIDHAYFPEKAILEMVKVLRKNCNALMVHYPNKAANENYTGLHQWNFSAENGDFVISSRNGRVNVSKKYRDRCKIVCAQTGVWLKTIILKV